MFALPVILIFTILLITIQIPIICTLYYSQNYMLKMLSIKLSINMESHPLRVRGLKLYNDFRFVVMGKSHPLRVRGLKQKAEDDIESAKQSHPLRVRGLKPRGTRFTNVNTGRILYGCVD